MQTLTDSEVSNLDNKDFHPQAEALIQQYTDEFSRSLQWQAMTLAEQWNDELILSKHVKRALDIMRRREQDQNQLEKWAEITGGVLLGIFGSGFISELTSGPTLWIMVYTLLGFVGLALIAFKYRR